jgi:hypothetical protein
MQPFGARIAAPVALAVLSCLGACGTTSNPPLQELPLSSDAHSNAISLNGYVTPVFSIRPQREGARTAAEGTVEIEHMMIGKDRFVVCPAPPVDAIATVNSGFSSTDRLKAAIGGGGQPVTNDSQFALAVAQAAATCMPPYSGAFRNYTTPDKAVAENRRALS